MPIGPVLHALERQQEAQEEAEALRQEAEAWRHVAAYHLGDYVYSHGPTECRAESERRALERGAVEAREFARELMAVARRQRDACAVHLSGCGYSRGVVRECEETPLVEVDE